MITGRFFSKIFSRIKELENMDLIQDRYVWMDLEMTGLDVKIHKILEVGCIITTPNLHLVHEGINLVLHQPEEVLKSMSDWCLVHHEKSGLTNASRKSKISVSEADELISEYIKKHTNDKGVRFLAGNSVHLDRIFINKYMPSTSSLFHYRILDISALKILCSHWYPDEYSKLHKKRAHRALDDILESINELKNYQKVMFKS